MRIVSKEKKIWKMNYMIFLRQPIRGKEII